MGGHNVKLFLSCVSDEFGAEREALRHELTGLTVDVAIQEDFVALGRDTLAKLDDYIRQCDVVVHLAGEMTGAIAPSVAVDAFLTRQPKLAADLAGVGVARETAAGLAYTQWEAWLAVAYGKPLLIAAPEAAAPRGPKFAPTAESRAAQASHLLRLRRLARYPELKFANRDQLAKDVFKSLFAILGDRIRRAGQPRNLPFASLGELFVGRETALEALRVALINAKGAAIAGRALHGLGGIGKTRLAIEYAWAHAADYSALLFVRADGEAALDAGLAALAGADVLNLPEKEAQEDAAKIGGALRWLEAHPTWLLILDNVDDAEAVAAVAKLMPRLKGGHVIVTARAPNFPASLPTLELDALDDGAATRFLIERTRGKRVEAADDAAQAAVLAHELGGLALGLEQAGAYISKQRIPFARYLTLWTENREKALAWGDATLTGSEKTLATTWVTSIERLSPESRRLIDRLAFFAPEPIPDSLFEVPVPGEAADYDAYEARAGLADYSLIAQAKGDRGAQGFVVHRLVQDFARRAMSDERREAALREALAWVNAAFAGDAQDVRSWPALDPLAPHALAVAERGDEAGIAEPTGRLLADLGGLFDVKARYAEAERLERRAVTIGDATLHPDDREFAARLNNLAELLRKTNRVAEAEPLLRRALAISEKTLGPDHPDVAIRLNNLASLLQDTNRLAEAEPLFRRALRIDEVSYGPDDPNVAIRLNNLALLLQDTNRLAEAEPLLRRALAIHEASLGRGHPYAATVLNNLASLLQATDRLADAEPLHRRALAIHEASYGPAHPDVATDMNNLALLLRATNRLAEAEPLHRRALAIHEASYGPDHPEVATDLSNLAGLLQATNRLAEAEPLYRRALAIVEKSLGPDHPNNVTMRKNLAALLAKLGRARPAAPPKRGFLGRLFRVR